MKQKKGEERKKQVERQWRIIDTCVVISTLLGLFVVIGTIGHLDYITELGENYPILLTAKNLIVGFALFIPFVLRRMYGEK